MKDKFCKECNEIKVIMFFRKKYGAKDLWEDICKLCKFRKQNRRKVKRTEDIKRNHHCVDCKIKIDGSLSKKRCFPCRSEFKRQIARRYKLKKKQETL